MSFATWPFDLPAREALQLPGRTEIAWAVFDPSWYRAGYSAIVGALIDQSDAALLAFYLDQGQGLTHSPNALFDEAWHLRAYPAIKAMVDSGAFTSAFDAYCRTGNADRSPHWLFDELQYRRRYPDLTNDALLAGELANGYDHYLRHGNKEGRIGHPLFDPDVYRSQFETNDRATVEAVGPFQHFLSQLDQQEPERRTSLYFDHAWYVEQYPAVAEMIAHGIWRSALEHYLCNDTPTEFDPLPHFSEAFYLDRDPGLREVIAVGDFRNGYAHFLRHGARELRSPAPHIDLAWYASQEPVRSDLAERRVADAFAHFLSIGQPRGLPAAQPPEQRISETQARALFRRQADALLPVHGRAPLNFTCVGIPQISIVMVLRNQFPMTLMMLGSLRNGYPGDIDLILIDSASTDETRSLGHYVTGATVLRFDSDVGFIAGCNAALACAQADAVLILHNDIELAPGTIAASLRRLGSDPKIGAVGGKVIRTDGSLLEAGNIIWSDGSTRAYSRDASPLAPEANFARDVDFCSNIFLLGRRDVLSLIEGFDQTFEAISYEDADLCIRIREACYRVVYDPSVVLWRDGGDSESRGQADGADRDRLLDAFRAKHATNLATRHAPDGRAQVFARMADAGQTRVLFIEDSVPLRRIGSGFVRSNDIIQSMAAMGYAVTIFPVNGNTFELARVYADLPDTVEVMHDHGLDRLTEFLMARRDYYNVIWVARTHNLQRTLPALTKLLTESRTIPLIVLDTEAIAAVRAAEQAALHGLPYDIDAEIRREFDHAGVCQKFVAVTDAEAAIVRGLGFQDVNVIGHMRAIQPTARSFERRTGMLFVGAMHRMDSPNYDGLAWFVDSVLPLIEQALGWETRLTVVGYTDPGVDLTRFRAHPRVTLRGMVPDLGPLYLAHRVFVAPTRFAAGAPYKVHEAASFGLPVVATELLRRQLGWVHGTELLAVDGRDPAAFADAILSLYRDADLWTRLRDGALDRLRRDNDLGSYRQVIREVLGAPRADKSSIP